MVLEQLNVNTGFIKGEGEDFVYSGGKSDA